ncbi:MAG: hypothetical protein EWV83_14610 [Microcystis sp. M_OC_Ca_00000000_S217Cul]|uniref:Mobile element protein n=1 Tax=Microcystis panniformis FACHB-1757 TaxID=1638788 RepID=A0A0K1RY01_9CHRO|nr:hypothetical protein VL20_1480 [Microcystis panniformis FACHB-1757]TRT74828.1 MAG: hypothetical protein EWV83_14610 [Microcystis sp. M_OC_Ca_00000000_S217Cul]TRT90214.1 MAG: hypothetical protein EWV66_08840 [Microcystis sp. M_OC_Ca_00000000_C217Col]
MTAGASHFCKSTNWDFYGETPLLKSGVVSDFTTQSQLLGGYTPQTPERISFSVGCLHAAADTFVII